MVIIARFNLFASLHDHELSNFTHACQTQVYKEGDDILGEKHPGDHDLYSLIRDSIINKRKKRINMKYKQVMVVLIILRLDWL